MPSDIAGSQLSTAEGTVELLEQIGSGGFSTVYRGRAQGYSHSDVAVKVFDVVVQTEAARHRFLAESRRLIALTRNHQDLVRIEGSSFTDSGRPFLVMELCEGTFFDQVIQNGPLDAEVFVRVARQISSALAAIHEDGLYHTDVKPGNVFRRHDGQPALGDFGVSPLVDERTVPGTSAFTPSYVPPEVLEGGSQPSVPSDIYSLGATLYFLLAGRAPFSSADGGGQSLRDMVGRILLEEAPQLDRPDVPSRLRVLVAQCMAKDPADRPTSAASVVAELDRSGAVSGPRASEVKHPAPVAFPPQPEDSEGIAGSSNRGTVEGRGLDSFAISDRPSGIDLLGFAPLVVGLSRILDSDKTQLPIVAAVSGKWGAGKSSLMLQLSAALESDATEHRWLCLYSSLWQQVEGDQSWAAIARDGVRDCAAAMPSRRQRLILRWRMGVRRHGLGRMCTLVLLSLLAAVALASSLVADLSGQYAAVGGGAAALASIVAWGASYSAVSTHPLYLRLFRRDSDRLELDRGLSYRAEQEIRALLGAVNDMGFRVCVLLDDLDRCSPSRVTSVLETLASLTHADRDFHAAFVIGFDRAVVTANLEHAHEALIKQIGERNPARAERFADEYLEKIVHLQMSLTPTVHRRDYAAKHLRSIRPSSDQIDDFRRLLRVGQSRTLGRLEQTSEALADIADTTMMRSALEDALRLERVELLSRGALDVEAVEDVIVDALDMTPRQTKRFFNMFRLQLFVANDCPESGLRMDRQELLGVAKLVALGVLLPDLATAVYQELCDEDAKQEADYDIVWLRSLAAWEGASAATRQLGERVLAIGSEDSSIRAVPVRSFSVVT